MSEPRHFSLEQVADGAWAAIAIPDRGAVGNAGIVDLGGEALVFDATFTPQAGAELRAAAERLAGPVRSVVNSHWHADHRLGNSAFPDEAVIVSTTRTRELIETVGLERVEQMKQTDFAEVEEDLRSRGKHEEVELLREFVASLPALEQRLPGEEFEGRRDFSGSARTAELVTYGGGHTESDAFLLVPDLRVLFAGDLVLVRSHAWMGDGEPPEWLRILDRLRDLAFDVLVAGHGPVGGPNDVEAMRAYLEDVLEAALEQGPDAPMPAPYEKWGFPDGWARNLAAVAAR